MKPTISVEQFFGVDLRIGCVRDVKLNEKARKPAYVLSIDFGGDFGVRQSSAQLTADYTPEQLIGKQVVAVCNFPPRLVAGVKSEVLVLAAVEASGRTIILQPQQTVVLGTHVA